MLKILTEGESLSSVERFLKSQDLVNQLPDLVSSSPGELCEEVRIIVEDYTDFILETANVIVCKVIDEEIDIVEPSYKVIKFNGNYYDYGAQRFNNSFGNLIQEGNIPVVQPIITSDKLISEYSSTIKGYTLLGV